MKPLAPNLQLNTFHFSPMNRISWTEGCENSALTRGAQRRLPTLMIQLGQVSNRSFPKYTVVLWYFRWTRHCWNWWLLNTLSSYEIPYKSAWSYFDGVVSGQQQSVVFPVTICPEGTKVSSPLYLHYGVLDRLPVWVHHYSFHPCAKTNKQNT